jgi:hypothetical protein
VHGPHVTLGETNLGSTNSRVCLSWIHQTCEKRRFHLADNKGVSKCLTTGFPGAREFGALFQRRNNQGP